MKKLFLFWLLLGVSIASHAQSITTSVAVTSICLDSSTTMPAVYNATGVTFNANNVFTLEISDANGSFANPIVLSQIWSTNSTGTFPYWYSPQLAPGTGYRLRVNSSDPAITGTDNGTDLTLLEAPAVSAASGISICEGNALALTSLPVPGASFSWSGPNGFNSTDPNPVMPNVSPANSGYYYLYVSNGTCTSTTFTHVSVNSGSSFVSVNSNQPVCPGGVLTLFAWGNFNTYNWTGPNGFTATGATVDIVNLQPSHYGTYTVTATGGGTCGGVNTIDVGPVAAPFAYTQTPNVCPGETIYLGIDSVNLAQGYSWVGPNGFTSTLMNPAIPNATSANSGTYTAYEIYNSCISAPAYIQINVSATLTVTASNNGPVNQGSTVILTAGGSQGNYQWTGPNGYTASGTNPYIGNAAPSHSGNYTVSLTAPGCTPETAITNVVVNEMNLVQGHVYNDLNNNGVQDAGENGLSNVIIELQPGSMIAYTDSLGNYSAYVFAGSFTVTVMSMQGNQTASPGSHTVSFTGTGNSSSGNDFGLHSTPANDLVVWLTEVWNTAPGFDTYIRITCQNMGTNAASGTIRFLPDAILVNASGTSGSYTMAGDTMVWNFSNLQPGASTFRYVFMTVPATTTLGTAVTSSVVATPVTGDIYPANNYFTLNQTVVGSWDPNDKQVQPAGDITPAQAAAGLDLVYKVRFQNTGTAPAVNIMILDTLSDNLDLSTFQMLSASHNYQLNVKNPKVLEWKFNNIMLPDSNTNEPESHGFVQYRIRPLSTLGVGDKIENTAHIYFDFNEAIITNTTVTEVALPTGVAGLQASNNMLLYPNPNTGKFTIELSDCEIGNLTISLTNLLGQQVYTEAASTRNTAFTQQLNVQNLPAGVYLLQVQQGSKLMTKRMVIQK